MAKRQRMPATPVVALSPLLLALNRACAAANSVHILAEWANNRRASRNAWKAGLDAMGRSAAMRVDARLAAGETMDAAMSELSKLHEAAANGPPDNAAAGLKSAIRETLTEMKERCDAVRSNLEGPCIRRWLKAGGVNNEGIRRDVELRVMLGNLERTCDRLLFAVSDPRAIVGDDVDSLAAFGQRIWEMHEELRAVLESPVELSATQSASTVVDSEARAPARATAVGVPKPEQGLGLGIANTNWKDVQERLLGKRERGEPYTSARRLASELGCSTFTIRKAIQGSDSLKGWLVRTSPMVNRKATELSAMVKDNARQTKEPAPDEFLPDDEVDVTMDMLIAQARPDERVKLNALDREDRRALARTYRAQRRDMDPSPLAHDKPGARPFKVKQHKRA